MRNQVIMIIVSVSLCQAGSVLNRYDSHRFEGCSHSINPFYEGALFMTGGADAAMRRYIKDMPPEKIGYVASNKIVLFGDETHVEETYSFKKVKLYRVVKAADTFYVNYMRAKRDGKPYEIVIEFTSGPNYERVLWIFYKGKPHTMVLWKEKRLVIPPQKA